MKAYKYSLLIALVFLITAITLGVIPFDSIANASYKVIQLTDNDVNDLGIQINNNGYVIWQNRETAGGPVRIYLYNGDEVTQLPLSSNASNLRLNNNNKIAFNEPGDGVYIYDLNNGSYTKILDHAPIDAVEINNPMSVTEIIRPMGIIEAIRPMSAVAVIRPMSVLEINDSDYVLLYRWSSGYPLYGNIYLYDGENINQITNDSFYKWHVDLDYYGNELVWYGSNSLPLTLDNLEIFQYDGTETISLTTNDYLDQFPNIANGNVVWTGFPGESADIFLYDGTTIKQITDNDYTDQAPEVNSNGWVVWEGFEDGAAKIFLYNGKAITQLTDNDDSASNPKINNTGHIVWYESHHYEDDQGWYYRYDDIFVYDGSTVTKLTDGLYEMGGNQIINDKGDIVWYARKITVVEDNDEIIDIIYGDLEIFLAIREIAIGDVLDFFDESVADGSIYGRGRIPRLANFRLWIFKQMLKTAESFIEKEKMNAAGRILNRAFLRSDGKPRPKDFIRGEAIPELADMILNLRESLGCE